MASSIGDPTAETDSVDNGNAEQLRPAADECFSAVGAVKRGQARSSALKPDQAIFGRYAHLPGASVDGFLRNRRLESGD